MNRILVALLLTFPFPAAVQPQRQPMQVAFEETTTHRWLKKPVLESRLLDDMEDPPTWTFRGKGEMAFTRERARSGAQSLRIHTQAGRTYDPSARVRNWISANAIRHFDGEDWTRFNRVSFWVYPDLPGFNTVALTASISGKSAITEYEPFGREARHYFNVANRRWTQVVWEITHLPRESVTAFTIQYIMNGKQPDASGEIDIDVDRLELQRVEPDHYEGWDVAPGRLAFSHSGYQTGAPKTAIASGLEAREFQLVRQDTGEPAVSKPVRIAKTGLGSFQVLDFSEAEEPGVYVLRAGGRESRPFRIGADVWKSSVWKALNFFYVERCGMEIPGVHRVCHLDWQVVHGDKRIVINGGWHDAGDLSQGPVNTAEAAYAMLSLAERLRATGEDAELTERVLDEAKWGVQWLLKTTFGGGYRVSFSAMAYWSDGILGTDDDVIARAVNIPYENFLTASAEALGAIIWKDIDPGLAAHCLRVAREDWSAAVAGLESPERQRGPGIDTVAAGVLASLELLRATGETAYGDRARALAEMLLESQQRTFLPEAKTPLAGFFYTGPAKDRILHYEHRGHEQGPIVALARLCRHFPDDPNWMRWYSAVALHSEYLKTAAKFTEPYAMLAASVYREDEYERAPENLRESLRRSILNGIPVARGYRLRLFPAWSNMRGNHGTVLSQTKALTDAAHLRNDLDAARLGQRQLEWVVGRNPFGQSTMYGEGYDYPPLYTISSGDIVGALPVGIQTRGDNDVPFWPGSDSYVYREVWVHPVSRWIWLMRDLAGPAVIHGLTVPGTGAVELLDGVGKRMTFEPDPHTGTWQARIPQGVYLVRGAAGEKTITALPAGTYAVDLRPGRLIDLAASATARPGGRVTIRAVVRGTGSHTLTVRTDNLEVPNGEQPISAIAGKEITWMGRVKVLDSPWVAVVVPDGDLTQKQELIGAAEKYGPVTP